MLVKLSILYYVLYRPIFFKFPVFIRFCKKKEEKSRSCICNHFLFRLCKYCYM